MKKLLTALKWSTSLSVSALFMGTLSCTGGFKVDVLPLDPALIFNYGTEVTAGRASAEAVVLGQLMPGSGQERTAQVFNSEVKDMSRCVMRMKDLPNDYGFDSAQETNFNAWVDGFQNKLATISPDIQKGRQSMSAARSLAGVMEAEVKTNGALELRLKDGEKFIPDTAKSEFAKIAKDCTDSYNRVYQTSLVLAQAIAQKEALAHLNKIGSAIQTLGENAESKRVFTTPAHLQAGQLAVKVAESKLQGVRSFIDGMTRKSKIGSGLGNAVAELKISLTGISNDYVATADIALRPDAKRLADEAIAAANALDTTVMQYRAGVEDLKDGKTDSKLDALVTQAFTGSIAVVLGDFSLDRETDVNELSRSLGSSKVVVMKQDSSSMPLVEALASAVVHGVAANYGLPDVNNVWGLRADTLIKAKSDFGMNEADFSKYSKSRAEKARESLAKEGNSKNVYVIFADTLATESADISGMIDELAADNGRVLLITSEPNRYQNRGAYFAAGELDIPAAIMAGNAILQQYQLPVPAQQISEKVVRLAAGLKGTLRLGDLGPLMKDAALQVSTLKNPSSTDIENRVMNALAAHNVPISLARSSRVLADDLSVVRSNLARDRSHYIQIGQGFSDIGLRTREADENRKTGEAIRNFQMSQTEALAREGKTTQLKIAYEGYLNDLEGVRRGADLAAAIATYKNDVDDARSDALGTMSSMDALLDSDLCRFKGRNETSGNAADYDGGWDKFTNDLNAPAKQAFMLAETKNPLSLFVVNDDNVVFNGAYVGDAARKAAVSLNCFLTGPSRNNQYDGRHVLKGKIANVKVLVGNVARQAKTFASTMSSNNPAQVLNSFNDLSTRITAPTVLVANPNYWKIAISPFDAAAIGGPFGPEFDVKTYVYPIPDVSADALRLTPQSANLFPLRPNYMILNDLPEYFLSQRRPGFGGNAQFFHLNSDFNLAAMALGANVWTNARVYGHALQISGLLGTPGTLQLNAAVGVPIVGAPSKAEFDKLNRRLWAWFLSRIAGKITDDVPLVAGVNELYEPQGGTDYFDNDHVFIERVFKLTRTFLQKANRHMIADKALQVLKEYKQMAELVYSLPTQDYNAFLNQVPATPLSTYFKRMESIMTNRANINAILNDTRANMTNNWFNEFFHAEISTILPVGTIVGAAAGANALNGFGAALAPPAGGENNRLATIWPALVAATVRISNLKHEIVTRINFVNP